MTTTLPTTGPHEIQRMLPRHFKILEMKIAGYSNVDIAKTLEIHENTVSAVSRSPLFVSEFNRQMQKQHDNALADDRAAFVSRAKSILDSASERAAEVQVELLDSEDDSVRLRSSGTILDRALGRDDGLKGGTTVNVQINTQDAQLITTAFKESQNGSKIINESTDGPSTCPSKNGRSDVHQTSE